MIVPGTAVVNPSTQEVELKAPMGFGTARGVRVSNFTGDSLVLTNISGVDQSQEFLAPQTQMVYPTANVGAIPNAVGISFPPEEIAANILVEWSTDPDADFLGTYPAALPAAVTTTSGVGRLFQSSNVGAVIGSFTTIGKVSTDCAIVKAEITAGGVPCAFQVVATELNLSTGAQASTAMAIVASDDSPTMHVYLPIRLTHLQDLQLAIFDIGANPATALGCTVSSTVQDFAIPLVYCDLVNPLRFHLTDTPGAGPNTLVIPPTAIASNPTAASALGECETTLAIQTSGTGLITEGWLTAGANFPDDPVLVTTNDGLPVFTGAAFDTLIAKRVSSLQAEAALALLSLTFGYNVTTDVGDIIIDVVLRQTRNAYAACTTE